MSTDLDSFAERFIKRKKEYEIDKLFRALVKLQGSDLHLKVDRPPHVRIKGELRALERGPIDDEEMTRIVLAVMDERSRKILTIPAELTFPINATLTASHGGSVSMC